jgi:hypothetical protein
LAVTLLECLCFLTGCERFSSYTGYSSTFEWMGNYEDMTPRDSSGRRMCSVVAIDALKLGNRNVQYTPSNLLRELNKVLMSGKSFICLFTIIILHNVLHLFSSVSRAA